MEKINIPIDKRLYDVICLLFKVDNPDSIPVDDVAGEFSAMVMAYLDREQEFGDLDATTSAAYDAYVRDMMAAERKRNSKKSEGSNA